MAMTKPEAIQSVCEIVALAYHSIGDYSLASDGFCELCAASPMQSSPYYNYQNRGEAIEYVRQAVLAKLKADGHAIDPGFDPVTGKDVTR